MLNIQNLIQEKLDTAPEEKQKDERKRFIVLLTDDMDDQITELSLATRTGKIELTSQILEIGLAEAHAKCVDSGVDFDALNAADQKKREDRANKNSDETSSEPVEPEFEESEEV